MKIKIFQDIYMDLLYCKNFIIDLPKPKHKIPPF